MPSLKMVGSHDENIEDITHKDCIIFDYRPRNTGPFPLYHEHIENVNLQVYNIFLL